MATLPPTEIHESHAEKPRNRAMNSSPKLAVLLSLAIAAGASAQDNRPVAFTNARIVTVAGKTIEHGTLVLRNGKIDALGADVQAPPGARLVDGTGLTILPGLVDAWTRTGFQAQGFPRDDRAGGSRRGSRGQQMPMPPSGGGAQNRAATKVTDGLYARQPVFGEMLRAGVTSLAVTPSGSAFPGLGALLRLDGKTNEQLVARDDLFVGVGMARDAQTKKLLKDNFEKAQKLVEERKKPPEPKAETPPEAKPGEAKPETKPGDAPANPPNQNPQPTPTPQPQPTPQPKPDAPGQGAPNPAAPPAQAQPKKPEAPKDPNLEVLADLLEGKRRALLQIDSAADLAHWLQVVPDTVKFPRTLVVQRHDPLSGTLDAVVDQVKALQCSVLLPLDLSALPRTRYLISPPKRLHDAGIEVGFLLGDNPATVRTVFFRLMELVRNGLPADVALRGVTQVPAKALGIDCRVGTLEVGKDADLLVFRGDPLTPSSELIAVWLAGREVPQQP